MFLSCCVVGRACTANGLPACVVTCDTLAMFAHGTVQITARPSFRHVCTASTTLRHYVPAECTEWRLALEFSSKTVERVSRLFYCL